MTHDRPKWPAHFLLTLLVVAGTWLGQTRLLLGKEDGVVLIQQILRPDEFDYAGLSPDGARLASFTRNWPGNNRVIDKDRRVTFTIAVLDLATGAELLRQELPFREKLPSFRQPRWTDAKTIELMPADYLYRIRLKF